FRLESNRRGTVSPRSFPSSRLTMRSPTISNASRFSSPTTLRWRAGATSSAATMASLSAFLLRIPIPPSPTPASGRSFRTPLAVRAQPSNPLARSMTVAAVS
ncbi:MAG: hypothetical protein ACK55Z_03975, partial [bacterium]